METVDGTRQSDDLDHGKGAPAELMLAYSDFKALGYQHLQGYFDIKDIENLEWNIDSFFRMQAHKIKDYRNVNNLTDILEAMEAKDKVALYQVQKFLSSSQLIRSFFKPELMSLCASLLNAPHDLMLLEGPALFVSRPRTHRLLYKWHSEAHYYPKRRKFINLWFPLFTDRTAENGAMHLKEGSHKEAWDFAEYNDGPNTFVQYEVPDDWVNTYPTYECAGGRGDLIMFDRNLIHKSCENRSDNYAFAVVARAWCPIDDLTLSGTMSATPYGGDVGRADLVAER
jgi:hypothetical protein